MAYRVEAERKPRLQRISVWMTHIASCTHTVSLKDLLDQPYIHWPTRRSTSTQPAVGASVTRWRLGSIALSPGWFKVCTRVCLHRACMPAEVKRCAASEGGVEVERRSVG